MDSIRIQGGVALEGKVRVQGSKNAVLPILAATLLTKETSRIMNCPKIHDVYCMIGLLKSLGVCARWEKNGIRLNAQEVHFDGVSAEAVKGMRSSLCLLGALIGRCGEVIMEYPGGCVIGERPIDMHINALGKMGVEFALEGDLLKASARSLHGADIVLPFPSVGTTENIILAAVTAEGMTVVEGAAREPEVVALCEYLNLCGAAIEGAGTPRIVIRGTGLLYGADYRVPADRIVAGTYMFATVASGGYVFLEEAPSAHMQSVIRTALQMGALVWEAEDGVFIQAPEKLLPVELISTGPYPCFPTDMQSQALAVLTKAEGKSRIVENIFENRFRILEPLERMGARIVQQNARCVDIYGVEKLQGVTMEAKELRGGAALVIAALAADGESILTGCSYIYRGYENICKDLRELGARVISV